MPTRIVSSSQNMHFLLVNSKTLINRQIWLSFSGTPVTYQRCFSFLPPSLPSSSLPFYFAFCMISVRCGHPREGWSWTERAPASASGFFQSHGLVCFVQLFAAARKTAWITHAKTPKARKGVRLRGSLHAIFIMALGAFFKSTLKIKFKNQLVTPLSTWTVL